MVFVSRVVCVVFKTTGGRLWTKPWGLPRLTKTQKENRRKTDAEIKANMSVLKAAAAAQPEVPVRLARTSRRTRVEKAAAVLEKLGLGGKVASTLLPRSARAALEAAKS